MTDAPSQPQPRQFKSMETPPRVIRPASGHVMRPHPQRSPRRLARSRAPNQAVMDNGGKRLIAPMAAHWLAAVGQRQSGNQVSTPPDSATLLVPNRRAR